MKRLILRFSLILGGAGIAAGLYQNCGPGFSAKPLEESISASSSLQEANCLFNGLPIVPGGSVTAFKLPNALAGQQCISETRTCSNGVLSGSYTNASCIVTAPGNCALGDQEITNGATASGYSAMQVPAGQACSSVAATSTCKNGQLVPSIYPTCSVATPTSCKFNNQYIPDGVSITAFLASTVPYGALCSAELRTCKDGVLSGSFTAETCKPAAAASCQFGSTTIADGSSVQVFSKSIVPYGTSCSAVQESITCKNGVFVFANGSLATNQYSTSCVPSPTTTCQYGGKTLQSGESINGYLKAIVPLGQTCNYITATCNGGVMTGLPTTTSGDGIETPLPPSTSSPLYPTCEVGGCLFGGTPIANEKTVTVYTSSMVGYSQTCSSVQKTLTCKNGAFFDSSGNTVTNYSQTCQPAASTSCSFKNFANGYTTVTVTTGQTLTGYASASVLEGSTCASVQETVSCNDGIISLNGTPQPNGLTGVFYLYSSCNVGACKISDQMVMNGATVTAYSTYIVPYGQSCSSVQATLTCKNTVLYNGTVKASSGYGTECSAMSTPDCSVRDYANGFNTIKFKNGQTVTGYSRSSAGTSNTCDSYKVTLKCVDGFISVNDGPPTAYYNNLFYSTCN